MNYLIRITNLSRILRGYNFAFTLGFLAIKNAFGSTTSLQKQECEQNKTIGPKINYKKKIKRIELSLTPFRLKYI